MILTKRSGDQEWVSPRVAAGVLGVSELRVYKMGLLGQIRFQAARGENVRFSARDVVRIAEQWAPAGAAP